MSNKLSLEKNDVDSLFEMLLSMLIVLGFTTEADMDADENLRQFEYATGTLKEMSLETRKAFAELCRKAAAERRFSTKNEDVVHRWVAEFGDDVEHGRSMR